MTTTLRHTRKKDKMYILCNSCGKEYNDLVEGVRYSSIVNGILLFCSDRCCKNYVNTPGNVVG
jgi:hypothetical protein